MSSTSLELSLVGASMKVERILQLKHARTIFLLEGHTVHETSRSVTGYHVRTKPSYNMLVTAISAKLQYESACNVTFLPQTCEEMSLMASAKCLWRRSTHMVSFSFSTCCFSSTCPAAVSTRMYEVQ